jgi:hypothetical protein
MFDLSRLKVDIGLMNVKPGSLQAKNNVLTRCGVHDIGYTFLLTPAFRKIDSILYLPPKNYKLQTTNYKFY